MTTPEQMESSRKINEDLASKAWNESDVKFYLDNPDQLAMLLYEYALMKEKLRRLERDDEQKD